MPCALIPRMFCHYFLLGLIINSMFFISVFLPPFSSGSPQSTISRKHLNMVETPSFFSSQHPWQINQDVSAKGEIPYHVIVGGSAVLEYPEGGPARQLMAGDILVLPHGSLHILHDGSGATPVAARNRADVNNITVSENENDGADSRLDMLCGRFIVTAT